MKYITRTPEETSNLGKEFASRLTKGDTVCLDGEMGAGKTVFVQGCARALGYNDAVTSPTFTLCNEYITDSLKVLHYDLYRIMDEDDLFSVGFYDNDGDRHWHQHYWLIHAYVVPEYMKRQCDIDGYTYITLDELSHSSGPDLGNDIFDEFWRRKW